MTDICKQRFDYFENEIKKCLLLRDIAYFIEDLDNLMNDTEKCLLKNCDDINKGENFFNIFKSLSSPDKYTKLKNSAEKHNKWIYTLLCDKMEDRRQLENIKLKYIILDNILSIIRKNKHTFVINEVFIQNLYSKEIITKMYKDRMEATLKNQGSEAVLFEIFDVISCKDPDWYGHFLAILAEQDAYLFHLLCECSEDAQGKDLAKFCLDYADNFIKENVIMFEINYALESGFVEHDCDYPESSKLGNDRSNFSDSLQDNGNDENNSESLQDNGSDDNNSDYGSYVSESLNDIDDSDEFIEDTTSALIELKSFQGELVKYALEGQNDIIYAPTGSGKTILAVHIANEHLKKNPKGKVAFLVHRIPLVTQQYKVFEKYKTPGLNVIDIRGRTDNVSGPLCHHMRTNQIVIMTSDILRNALQIEIDDKISSITEFSLIFFDECHNCMKSHPYVNIMKEYFREKYQNQNKKLPQIVGLTASPRSNKKNSTDGMKKSLYELCGNLDCFHVSMVKTYVKELEDFLAQTTQKCIKTDRRGKDEFASVLIKQMEFCESKLEKMRRERYFPPNIVRSIPIDKYKQEYVGFVGNLERLNTETTEENDGKQKAYSIYKFLNAFYRGLTVNSMFNQIYAKQTIQRYLKHNGVDFTCTFDEEFYKNYRDHILNKDYEQSENPSINTIVTQIIDQTTNNDKSRILIFVREIEYTNYLVKILTDVFQIPAEVIVGKSARSDFTTCSDSEVENILNRFESGKTKVLVATTVVEEGLNVALCNMVISYGHVTNETAMIQRQGRVRALDSKYILVLPPMLVWLERKELLNEHRKNMMRKIIDEFGSCNLQEMDVAIKNYQISQFGAIRNNRAAGSIENSEWKFTCKNCQTNICTSNDLKIIENAHRVCIIPELLGTFKVVKETPKAFGHQGSYEYAGRVLCNKCNNHVLGGYIYYRKTPFFQPKVDACNCIHGKTSKSFKKWGEFAKLHTLPPLEKDDFSSYLKRYDELKLN